MGIMLTSTSLHDLVDQSAINQQSEINNQQFQNRPHAVQWRASNSSSGTVGFDRMMRRMAFDLGPIGPRRHHEERDAGIGIPGCAAQLGQRNCQFQNRTGHR